MIFSFATSRHKSIENKQNYALMTKSVKIVPTIVFTKSSTINQARAVSTIVFTELLKGQASNAISGNVFFWKNKPNIENAKAVNHSLATVFLAGNYSPWIRDGDYVLIPDYHEDWTKLEQLGIYLLLKFSKLIAIERGEVLIYRCTLKDTYDNG